MDHAALRAFLRSRSGWLLALVLLLPLAQAFAVGHVISHAQADEAARSDGPYALHQSVCNVCLTVAAIAGGALPAKLPDFAPMTTTGAAPSASSWTPWFAITVRAYESRAPPLTGY